MVGKNFKVYPHRTLSPREVEWGEWDIRTQNGDFVELDQLSSIWNYETNLKLSISVRASVEGLRRVLGGLNIPLNLVCEVQCRPTYWSIIQESDNVALDSTGFFASVAVEIPGRQVSGALRLRAALVGGALDVEGHNQTREAYIATSEKVLSLSAEGAGMPFSQLDFSQKREWDINAPWVVKCDASNPEAVYSRCVRIYVNKKHPAGIALFGEDEKDYEILEPAISRDFLATLVREIYIAHLNDNSLYTSQKEATEENYEDFQVVGQKIIMENLSMTIPKLIDALKRDWNSVQSKIDGATGYMQKGWN